MSLGEHLAEARRRLLVCTVAILVFGTVCFITYTHILTWLAQPYCEISPQHTCHFIATGPLDGLSLRIKIAFFGGALSATPVIFWQLWRFVTPGLRAKERRYAVPFVGSSIVFFLAGCLVAYLSFAHALKFLVAIGGHELTPYYNPNSYLSLVILMMVAFGATFEFPVILVALELAGVISPASLLHHWRPAIIGITIAAAVLTPSGDPVSMFVMMIPLIVFYFGSIGIGKLAGK
jgi:sec-independent protein translocase protein TatC